MPAILLLSLESISSAQSSKSEGPAKSSKFFWDFETPQDLENLINEKGIDLQI